MKNWLLITLSLATVLSLSSAKRNDEPVQTEPVTKKFMALETCEQMALIPSDNLRAAGSAIAKNVNEAKAAAAADARNQLAMMMRVVVSNTSDIESSNKKRRAKDVGEVMLNQYVYQSLDATRPIHWSTYELSDGTVQVYVCMEMVSKSDEFLNEMKSRVEAQEQEEQEEQQGEQRNQLEHPMPQPQRPQIAKPTSNPGAEALFEKGRDNCRRFNYRDGIPQLLEAVDKGSVNAQNMVGMMYLYGDNVEKDSKLSFQYLLSAANCGHKAAIFQVAEMYNSGTGVEKNKTEARYWYERADELGDARAESRLRRLY